MLETLVDFYRALGKPQICSMQFETELVFTENLFEKISQVDHSSLGQFKELTLDGESISLNELTTGDFGKSLFLRYKIGTGDCPFYLDISDLLKRNTSLKLGDLATFFYVASDDYYSKESASANTLQRYLQLQQIVSLINELKDLAHYHDAKAGKDQLHLVFVRDSEGGSVQSLQLTPIIDLSLLDATPITVSSIAGIGRASMTNPHSGRETSVFRTSMIEFLCNTSQLPEDRFAYLVLNWAAFIQLFKKNFDTYISGFAFHKARKEVADAEIASAEQLSKVFNDISGKVLGIPLSLASLVLIAKTEHIFEQLVLCFATLLASWLLAELMHSQQLQLERLKNARSLLFDEIKVKSESYPADLKVKILSSAENLDQNEQKVTRVLWVLRWLSWLPAIAAASLIFHLQDAQLKFSADWVMSAMHSCINQLQQIF